MDNSTAPQAALQSQGDIIALTGNWTNTHCEALLQSYPQTTWPKADNLQFDASAISCMDSVGAWLLLKLIRFHEQRGINIRIQGLAAQQQKMLDIVRSKANEDLQLPPDKNQHIITNIGETTYVGWHGVKAGLRFVGELSLSLFGSITRLRSQQIKSFIYIIDATGFRALPIIGLLTFLIGVVLAYQMGVQLRTYGAQIYVVNLTGIAILREFGPLITAIIVAGRTGSAFTAEIGTMKVNEELDALRTFGLVPIRFVILPKILGLFVALPLLVVWANIFGILGGMVTAKQLFDISYYDFAARFAQNVSVMQLYLGLLKAPFFALIIGVVGCFQGLQVSGGAASVGKRTTKSVVISIFFIIVADAIFSVLFSWRGL